MADHQTFQINIKLPNQQGTATLTIKHQDETFSTELDGSTISLINNGDNSWSQLAGNTPQETINAIGEGIEQYEQQQP